MFAFEKLIVYHKALALTEQIYTLTNNWPKTELFSLTDQLHRAIISIPLNIAERSSRSKKDFRHFLDIARGSCFESVAILTIAKNLKFIQNQQFNSLYLTLDELARIIQGLKKSIII